MPRSWRDRPWVVAAAPPTTTALVQPTDPQHSQPDPNMVPGQIDWRADPTLVPTLPDSLMGDQFLQLPVAGGPLDQEPQTHTYGVGVGPGLDDAQNRATTGPWHSDDRGAVDARRFQAQAARDGAYHVDVVPDESGGSSPATLALRYETGVGEPNSPHARRGYRIQRFRDRVIDRHMWDTVYRPAFLRNAYTAPDAPAVGGQYNSPYPGAGASGWAGRHGIGTPDQLVMPQQRRSPRPWDEDRTTDATLAPPDFGLTVWGL